MTRRLSPQEYAAWQRLIATVTPIKAGHPSAENSKPNGNSGKRAAARSAKANHALAKPASQGKPAQLPQENSRAELARLLDAHRHQPNEKAEPSDKNISARAMAQMRSQQPQMTGRNWSLYQAAGPDLAANLNGQWDRKMRKGQLQLDAVVDLHGHNLDQAWQRLDQALSLARHCQHRVILLITGKARPGGRNEGQGRGAIRASVSDWLAASPHAGAIASVRASHPRHGGAGALYIILKSAR